MSRWRKHETTEPAPRPVDPRMAEAEQAIRESKVQLGAAKRVAATISRVADVFDGIREHDHYSDLFEQAVRDERRG